MNRNSMCAWLVVTISTMSASCQPSRFVGTVCADESCALQAEPLLCGLTEMIQMYGLRDVPSKLEDFDMCTRSVMPRDEQGLVKCRVFWKFLPRTDTEPSNAPEPRCEDYDYLTSSSDELFRNDILHGLLPIRGATCLMRQVTREQAADGMSGWYYLDSAPAVCPNAGPGLRIPADRPVIPSWEVEIRYQCATAKQLQDDGSVEDVSPDQCPQPKPSTDARGVGDKCHLGLFLSDRERTLQLDDQCQTGACVATPLREIVCEDVNGKKFCELTDSRCSCRCAGTSADDPGPFCACPDDYQCRPVVSDYAASPEQSGSYCVPKDPNAYPRR